MEEKNRPKRMRRIKGKRKKGERENKRERGRERGQRK